jgi:glucokinase
MILAGDIGGTKTNLALFEKKGKELYLKESKQYSSREHNDLLEIIDIFKKEFIKGFSLKCACFGIAGPVIDGKCDATNLPWKTDILTLGKKLKTDNIVLINDLEATAYGMLYLKQEQFVSLNPQAEETEGIKAVIAAGTGLGEGILYFDGRNYHPMGTEGGHSDFAPVDEKQDKLLKWLRSKYNGHVSYERILSGEGLYTLYEFLKHESTINESVKMKALPKHADKSAMVSYCAIEEKDPLCIKTLELFCSIYGSEAGNLALKSLSLGGVYIGGGIAPKILPLLLESSFMENFLDKGRFRTLLKNIPVKISLNENTALLGAAYFARDKLIK